MFSSYLKKLTSALVMLLVVLQVLSPMLHQHPAGSSLGEGYGFHLHNDDFGYTAPGKNVGKTPTVSVQHLTLQVIGVPVGNEIKQQLLSAVLLVCLYFILVLDIVTVKSLSFPPETNLLWRRNPRHTSTQLRAPPL